MLHFASISTPRAGRGNPATPPPWSRDRTPARQAHEQICARVSGSLRGLNVGLTGLTGLTGVVDGVDG